MMKEEHIRQLIERFFDGETTLDEESLLYDYFATEQLADDLLPLRDMFLSLSVMAVKPTERLDEVSSIAPEHAKRRTIWMLQPATIAKIAASMVLPLMFGIYLWSYNRANYCEAYFYNSRVTDDEMVMDEVEDVLAALGGSEESQVDRQLKLILDIDN